MGSGLAGYLIRSSTKVPLISVVVEVRNVATQAITTTATTDADGYFSASGLADAVYGAAPRLSGTDWELAPDVTTLFAPTLPGFVVGSVLFVGWGPILHQNNAAFFWDNGNSRLGIGNAAPTVALDVTGAILASTTVSAPTVIATGASGLNIRGSSVGSSTGQTSIVRATADASNYITTLPNASDTVVELTQTQTLTNKTLSATGTSIPAIIAPASQGDAGGTTSGTTELTVHDVTITNPNVAGQIFICAQLSWNSPTVVDDIFLFRLYFGTTPTEISMGVMAVARVTTERDVVTIIGTAAVAASGTQIIRTTVARTSGTGTITIDGTTRTKLHWIIFPGAGTTV